MIQSLQEQALTLTSNTDVVTFSDTDLRTQSANCFNGWLNHNEGSAQFNIVAGGIYEIDFNTNITSATAGAVALAVYADGVKLNGTEMDEVIATAGDYVNMSTSKIIRVCGRGSVTLTINSVPTVVYNTTTTDTEIPIVKNAQISIRKLA